MKEPWGIFPQIKNRWVHAAFEIAVIGLLCWGVYVTGMSIGGRPANLASTVPYLGGATAFIILALAVVEGKR